MPKKESEIKFISQGDSVWNIEGYSRYALHYNSLGYFTFVIPKTGKTSKPLGVNENLRRYIVRYCIPDAQTT